MKTDALKVLVPVDFSETSRRALAWAYDYALRAPCELHILHVIEDRFVDYVTAGARDRFEEEVRLMTAEAKTELERMVPTTDREKIGKVVQHISRGHAAQEILRIADKLGIEMIVMGTHGRHGLERVFIGSVAERVVRHSNCPVVCVKEMKAS